MRRMKAPTGHGHLGVSSDHYPKSNKVFLRGLGVVARLEKLDYWDGEE